MTYIPYRNMNEVKRLVQAGKLAEATMLLQRVLNGGTAAPTATSAASGGIATALAKCASRIGIPALNRTTQPLRNFLDRLDTTRAGPRRRDCRKLPAAHADSAPDGARFIAQ